MKNIILQHFDGKLRELDKLSMDNISAYAKTIGAEYELVQGKPLNENLTSPCQKAYCIDSHWDKYDNVLMLDIDVFIRKFLIEDIFKVPGHSVHGPTQASCKLKLIKAGRIFVDTPYWAGSIYKFNRAERELLRSAMPEDPTWMEDYSVPYRFEDEGILSELAGKVHFPTVYMDFKWNQCSYLPNPQNAKMLHIRTKKPGHLTGTWETGDKRPKLDNYYDLKMRGII
jgi:hypothetical protein|tara:strand:+ start:769 stop:1449 length:681 start_codon:yes stop_codon:yes gene_type:complete